MGHVPSKTFHWSGMVGRAKAVSGTADEKRKSCAPKLQRSCTEDAVAVCCCSIAVWLLEQAVLPKGDSFNQMSDTF